MKRFLSIALAIVFGMACSGIFAQESKKAEMSEEEIMAKLDSLRNERAQKLQVLEAELNKLAIEELDMPCQEEAKNTDEYYGAWAVSDGQMNQRYAVRDAMRKAQLELAKQVGGEDTNTLTCEVICQRVMLDHLGNYIAYVAVRMPKNK